MFSQRPSGEGLPSAATSKFALGAGVVSQVECRTWDIRDLLMEAETGQDFWSGIAVQPVAAARRRRSDTAICHTTSERKSHFSGNFVRSRVLLWQWKKVANPPGAGSSQTNPASTADTELTFCQSTIIMDRQPTNCGPSVWYSKTTTQLPPTASISSGRI